MEQIFTNLYENKVWGVDNNEEYSGSSGIGSAIDYNEKTYIPFLRKFITDNNIRSIVDLGCGDFKCGKLIYDDLNISYIGYDIYKKVINYNSKIHKLPKYCFEHLDFCNLKENIINADICILKDVLQHWSFHNISNFLNYLVENKKFKYILICNDGFQTDDNADISDGGFRPLSSAYHPLNKYKPIKLYNYHHKEVSVIVVGS